MSLAASWRPRGRPTGQDVQLETSRTQWATKAGFLCCHLGAAVALWKLHCLSNAAPLLALCSPTARPSELHRRQEVVWAGGRHESYDSLSGPPLAHNTHSLAGDTHSLASSTRTRSFAQRARKRIRISLLSALVSLVLPTRSKQRPGSAQAARPVGAQCQRLGLAGGPLGRA